MTADPPARLTRVRDHSTSVADWLYGSTDVLDGLIVDEHITFTPDAVPTLQSTLNNGADAVPTPRRRWVPPVETVLVDEDIGTPVFDSVNADCQPGRTPKGRISRKPPRLPYTGGVAYQVFVNGSRDDHSTYHGGRR